MSSTLIGMISHTPMSKIDLYLRKLPPTELYSELTQRDPNGMTPLHLAIKKADTEIVRLLLNFDAPVSSKIGNKSCETYAQELMSYQPQKERRQVYALIKTRGEWQSSTTQELGTQFSRSMNAVEKALNKVHGAAKKSGVLFLGKTGEGKSTFINYLYGVNYRLEKIGNSKSAVPVPLTPEVVQTGSLTTSETLFPQVVAVKNPSYVLVDLPGFEDTRGSVEEICAAATICMLTKELSSIRALLLVVSWSSLEESKMLGYRNTAHHIGAMISHDPQTEENLILVVTKPEHDLAKEDVRDRLRELVDGEGWSEPMGATPVRRENLSDPLWKKHCLRKVTESFLSRPESIVIGDITAPHARIRLQETIDALEKKAKSPQLFDFKNYSDFLGKFQLIVQQFVHQYIEMTDHYRHLIKALVPLVLTIEEKEKEIDLLEKERNKLDQSILMPFNQTPFSNRIQEAKEKHEQLKVELTGLSNLKKKYEEEIRQSHNEIVTLEIGKDSAIKQARSRTNAAFDQASSSARKAGLLDNHISNALQNSKLTLSNHTPYYPEATQLSSEVVNAKAASSAFVNFFDRRITTWSAAMDACQAFISAASATTYSDSPLYFTAAAQAGITALNLINPALKAAIESSSLANKERDAYIILNENHIKLERDNGRYVPSEEYEKLAKNKSFRDGMRSEITERETLLVEISNTFRAAITAFQDAAQVITKAEEVKLKKAQELRINLDYIEQSQSNNEQMSWSTQDQIRQLEFQVAEENQRMKDSQAMYQAKQEIDRSRQIEISKTITLLRKELTSLLEEQEDSKAKISMLEVEHDIDNVLNSKVREIILALNLRDGEIDRYIYLTSKKQNQNGENLCLLV